MDYIRRDEHKDGIRMLDIRKDDIHSDEHKDGIHMLDIRADGIRADGILADGIRVRVDRLLLPVDFQEPLINPLSELRIHQSMQK
jgi:hypothetical protein